MFDFDPSDFRIDDLDRIARQGEKAMHLLTEAMAEIGETTGEGEAADGMIRVTVDSTGRATDVTLNPRVMRLSSVTLAEGMVEAFNAAHDDVQAKTQKMVAAALPEGITQEDVGQDKMRSRFDEALESFDQAMSERQVAFDRLKRDAGGPA
jgi:DNA-binding protein YbaB